MEIQTYVPLQSNQNQSQPPSRNRKVGAILLATAAGVAIVGVAGGGRGEVKATKSPSEQVEELRKNANSVQTQICDKRNEENKKLGLPEDKSCYPKA